MKLTFFAFILPLLPCAVSGGAHVQDDCDGNPVRPDACCDQAKLWKYMIYHKGADRCQSAPAGNVLDHNHNWAEDIVNDGDIVYSTINSVLEVECGCVPNSRRLRNLRH